MEDSPEGQRLRFLENEIHKTNLKLMEGETIKKKYMTILDMLKKERLTFGNQIEGLEAQLRKQEEEIEKLKVSCLAVIWKSSESHLGVICESSKASVVYTVCILICSTLRSLGALEHQHFNLSTNQNAQYSQGILHCD